MNARFYVPLSPPAGWQGQSQQQPDPGRVPGFVHDSGRVAAIGWPWPGKIISWKGPRCSGWAVVVELIATKTDMPIGLV
jgi:hypothetical protein